MARLIAAPLEALARAGGGAYSPITASDRDLETVLLDGPRSAPAHELSGAGVQRWTEPGVWLVPLLLLLAAAGFRRGWLAGLVMIMVVPPPAQALQWRDLWLRPDQQAAAALERGQPATAARQFADPSWRGMALYRAGDYAGAAEAFAQSGGAESDYNRGNALARAGRLEEAADAYRQVLREVPEHADAKANLALVEDLLRKNREQSDQAEGSSDERGAPPSESEEVNGGESRTDARGQSSSGDKPGTDSSEFPDGEAGDDRNRAEQSARQSQDESEPVDPSDEIGDRATEAAGEAADSMASAQRDVADSAHSQMGTDTDTTPLNQPPGSHSERPSERAIALDQWLRQIPDDPAGLLRRKFMLEHLQRQQER